VAAAALRSSDKRYYLLPTFTFSFGALKFLLNIRKNFARGGRNSGAWAKYRRNTCLMQKLVVLSWNYSSSDHYHIASTSSIKLNTKRVNRAERRRTTAKVTSLMSSGMSVRCPAAWELMPTA
jgi:hypothetical protein